MYSDKELSSLNDYELIYLIGMNDPEALMLLRMKYRPLEGFLYRKYFAKYKERYTRDDWFAECDSELFKAVRRFHDTDECSFKTYIELVFKRRALNVIRTFERKYQDLYIEDVAGQNSEDREQAADYLGILKDEKAVSAEKILEMDRNKMILNQLAAVLDEEEIRAVQYLHLGYSKSAIIRDYGISPYVFRKLRAKARRIRDEIDSD